MNAFFQGLMCIFLTQNLMHFSSETTAANQTFSLDSATTRSWGWKRVRRDGLTFAAFLRLYLWNGWNNGAGRQSSRGPAGPPCLWWWAVHSQGRLAGTLTQTTASSAHETKRRRSTDGAGGDKQEAAGFACQGAKNLSPYHLLRGEQRNTRPPSSQLITHIYFR